MSQQGTAILDFGAFPGSQEASLVITGQPGISTSKLLEAWVIDTSTVDHSSDEHHIDPPRVMAGSIATGVGFTIFGYSRDNQPVYGKWSVAWVWN